MCNRKGLLAWAVAWGFGPVPWVGVVGLGRGLGLWAWAVGWGFGPRLFFLFGGGGARPSSGFVGLGRWVRWWA